MQVGNKCKYVSHQASTYFPTPLILSVDRSGPRPLDWRRGSRPQSMQPLFLLPPAGSPLQDCSRLVRTNNPRMLVQGIPGPGLLVSAHLLLHQHMWPKSMKGDTRNNQPEPAGRKKFKRRTYACIRGGCIVAWNCSPGSTRAGWAPPRATQVLPREHRVVQPMYRTFKCPLEANPVLSASMHLR
jgi:hypothetical protein